MFPLTSPSQTLIDSSVLAYELFVRELSDAEKAVNYDAALVIAGLWGVRRERMPPTWCHFERYMATVVPALDVTPEGASLGRSLMVSFPWERVAGFSSVSALAALLLPRRIAARFGLRLSPLGRALFIVFLGLVSAVYAFVPAAARELTRHRRSVARMRGHADIGSVSRATAVMGQWLVTTTLAHLP